MPTFLTFLRIFSFLMVVAACVGLYYYGRRYVATPEGKRLIARLTGMKVAKPVDVEDEDVMKTDTLPSTASPEEKLHVAEPGQVVSYVEDMGRDHQVKGTMVMQPMTQQMFGQRLWVAKPEQPSKAILVGGEWIFRVPSAEGGRHLWMKGRLVETPGSLANFYKGTETNPGPAKKFKRLGQNLLAEEIVYTLPAGIEAGTTWKVHDIGKFRFEVTGDTNGIVFNGDYTYFVTSRQNDGEDWLFFIDAREEARGYGGLFRCEPFDPATDIKQLF